ncbi:MAG: hypothetical protein OEV94_03685 [Deltaproteobacteria bacterium]|nr:hypothetical protein [Deltaproteobacteria bacterium]
MSYLPRYGRYALVLIIPLVVWLSPALGEKTKWWAKYKLQVDRLGPVVVGMTPEEAAKATGVTFLPDEEPVGEDEISCHYISFPPYSQTHAKPEVSFMILDGRIGRIDVDTNAIPNQQGIRVGDSEEQVKKAYPGRVQESPHPYLDEIGKYLRVEVKPNYWFIFETSEGKVTSFRGGQIEAVQLIEGCQ